MNPHVYKIEMSAEQVGFVSLAIALLIILIFFLFHITKHMNSLTKEEREAFIKKWFVNTNAMDSILSILEAVASSFLYTDKTKKTNIRKRTSVDIGDQKQKKINNYLEEEYSSAKTTRMVFINLFFLSTVSVICAFIWLDEITYGVRITIGGLYFGLSLFVLFVIKSCYSRTAVIFSILEDQEKKGDIKDFLIKYKKDSELNDNDIELIRMINTSRAEREKSAKHPYEIILKNVAGSSISFGSSKLKVGEEEKKK